jgi:putative membrane protein
LKIRTVYAFGNPATSAVFIDYTAGEIFSPSFRFMPIPKLPATLLAVVLFALFVSGLHPYDRPTWWLETAPIFIIAPVLIATHRRFPLTQVLYILIAIHALILMVGGAYTYARVPFGFWLQDLLSLSRNPYDRIGHLFQGLVPALAAREILLRQGYMHGRRMAGFLALCVAMTVSACYELIEWAAAEALGQGADEFLGTQGDPWDTQWDMFMALIGASTSVFLLAPLHDRQFSKLICKTDGKT